MMGLPTSDWIDQPSDPVFPTQADWQAKGEVRHVFTHFDLTLKVWQVCADEMQFETTQQDAVNGLPSVFAKALKLVAPS